LWRAQEKGLNVKRIAAVVVALAALLIVPAQAPAAKKDGQGGEKAGPPSGCATQAPSTIPSSRASGRSTS
jgi:hypothetical protein